MSQAYKNNLYQLAGKDRLEQENYLSGLFTSKYSDKYGNQFYLHYLCPLCGEQVNVLRATPNDTVFTIDYEKDVAGSMVTDMRKALHEHYKNECGSERTRRLKTAHILKDKLLNGVYE